MKITSIVEDSSGHVVGVVIDDRETREIDPPVPRAELVSVASSLAASHGLAVDLRTLEVTPIPPIPTPAADGNAGAAR
jgi:hypothetical protein